jgi:hypothetical protein
MIPLARSDVEQRRFRTMAYLLDPAHDPRLLTHSPQARRPQSSLDRKTAEALIRALRLARQGERRNALTQARRFRLADRLPELTDTITIREFEEACQPAKQISRSLARRIMELELAWLPSGASEAPQADSTTLPLPSGWSRAVAGQGVDPVRPLSLDKLTDLDPRACRYRDGEWTTP